MTVDATTPVLSLEDIEQIPLRHGSHGSRTEGVCAMELVAWMAGEPHSDHPKCSSHLIGTFLRTWNDQLPDDETRNRLIRPLLPLVLNTASTVDVENQRAMRIYDWMVRVFTPAWLDLHPELTSHATALRALAPLVDEASARAAQPASQAAAVAAEAAWSAARSAARSAAESAVRPTVEQLQLSAQELIRELCAMGKAA